MSEQTENLSQTNGTEHEQLTCERRRTSIGGQALLEGIMMRGPKITAMAVRDPSGKIVLEKWQTASSRKGICAKPFIRGIFNMYDSLSFGYKCLMRSAEISVDEAEKDAKQQTTDEAATACTTADNNAVTEPAAQYEQPLPPQDTQTDAPTADADTAQQAEAPEASNGNTAEPAPVILHSVTETEEQKQARIKKQKQAKKEKVEEQFAMVIGTVLGIALAIGLFLLLPTYAVKWLSGPLPFLQSGIWKSVFEGVLRILIFIGYMAAMLLMKDIRRTFRYHGAEHKTIFCYENGLPLTVENVKMQKRFHPRCGTSFIILVLLVGIIVSMFIPAGLPSVLRVAIKLLCLPVVVGIGYELIKLAGRHDNMFTAIISAPGKALQHLTVLEPDDDMIECAIAAFTEVIPDDGSDKW